MEKWILVVKSNCADYLPGHDFNEDEKFNEWYDNFHLPDVMSTAGFVNARRFVSPDFSTMDTGRYLAIYEVETDDIHKTMAALDANLKQIVKKGRYSDLLKVISVSFYKQITAIAKPRK